MHLSRLHQLRLFLASSFVCIGFACGPGGDGLGTGGTKPPPATMSMAGSHPGVDLDAGSVDPGGFDAPICGTQAFMLQGKDPPDLLIVLDKSGSMDAGFPGPFDPTRWDVVSTAVKATVMALQMPIHWGLEFFPIDDVDSCGVDPPAVAAGPMTYSSIAAAIDAKSPSGGTPTGSAVTKGHASLAAAPEKVDKYILLATDGVPESCDPGDPIAAAVQAVSAAASAKIHTFVVGIAADPGSDDSLNQMAVAGMEPQGGTTKYYPVANQQDLINALQTIAGHIVSCTLDLQNPPDFPDGVSLVGAGKPIPRDPAHHDGWDFGPGSKTVELYGSWCDQLKSGNLSDIKATFSCAPIGFAPGPKPVSN